MVSAWRCTWKCAGQEGFDADHVAFAAEGAIAQRPARESLVTITVIVGYVGSFFRGDDAEKPAAGGKPGHAVTIGQQTVTANMLEAVGQHM